MTRTADDQPVVLIRRSFAARHVGRLRDLVTWAAHRVGLNRERGLDLALAVSEAANNAIRHGGDTGQLALLQDRSVLIAEISDNGSGSFPPTPATLPPPDHESGRGRYLMQELCDRVEYRATARGTVVHLEMSLDAR